MSRKSFEKYYTTLKEALEDGENIDDTDFKILEKRLRTDPRNVEEKKEVVKQLMENAETLSNSDRLTEEHKVQARRIAKHLSYYYNSHGGPVKYRKTERVSWWNNRKGGRRTRRLNKKKSSR